MDHASTFSQFQKAKLSDFDRSFIYEYDISVCIYRLSSHQLQCVYIKLCGVYYCTR